MTRTSNHLKDAAARARAAKSLNQFYHEDFVSTADSGECQWDGTVNHIPSDSEDPDWSDMSDSDSEEEFSELEGEELLESLQMRLEKELELLSVPTPYEKIAAPVTSKQWAKAESNRCFSYNGQSVRTKRRVRQQAWEKEKDDCIT